MKSDYLIHYGTPRHSGRYPYGSGENPRAARQAAHAERQKQKKKPKQI